MYIRTKNKALRKLYNREIMGQSGPIEFSEDGRARVTKDVGMAVCEEYEDIVPDDDADETGADEADTEEEVNDASG